MAEASARDTAIDGYREGEAREQAARARSDQTADRAPQGRSWGLARSATMMATTGKRRFTRAATSMAVRSQRHVPVTLHDLTTRKPDVLALLMLLGYMFLGTLYFHLTLGWCA